MREGSGKGAVVVPPTKKVVVLTALPLEYRAMRRLLEEPRRVDHAGTIFECGRLAGTSTTVCLAVTGAGNDSAAVITERAINFFQPEAVFFTGIAGSLKADVSPGDVVVAIEVYSYHGGKQDPDGFKARPRGWEASYSLQQVAMYVDNVGAWAAHLAQDSGGSAEVHFKPIVTGDVVVNAPAGSPLRVFLDEHYNGAVAVEMEAAGFANAAHKAEGVPHLMIRGVSDRADGTKQSTDSVGLQGIAAENAASFTAEVIAHLTPADVPAAPETVVSEDEPTDELIWQPLDQPTSLAWHRDLVPSSAYTSAPALLEIHLAPVSVTSRVTATRMQQLADELVNLGRGNGLFSNTERVETQSSAEVTVASVTGRNGRSAGLAITRSGQRSAWESLPQPGIGFVLDREHTQGRIATLLSLLEAIDVPTAPAYAPAVGIENPRMVMVERLSAVNPTHATFSHRSDAPVRVDPEEAVTAAMLVGRSGELAEELTARLLLAFRGPGRS
ncbi:5'-methylthioadenosine/S-adenosylhomocysteine nucleosidase family protein [Streptomyces viridochromogenes]|uniref:5'-methylthioadenosine/S-adenosylhomocysteine nucleosidase family protein n=1 Tax=Streptomyces viridochromogenes TaxID=1938 RepID=UPI00068EF662|nr:5'-methylthioadenosine/S-adenosylhomocysteine nucleosidase [Streptomyces viridochromogenes]